jgi:hypothetical protein
MVMANKTTVHPSSTGSAFSPIEDIIADLREGKMVIMEIARQTLAVVTA